MPYERARSLTTKTLLLPCSSSFLYMDDSKKCDKNANATWKTNSQRRERVREKRRKKIFLFFFESTRSVSHPRAVADSAGTHTQNGMKPIMKRYCESKETFPIQNVLPSSPFPPTHTNIYSEKQKKKEKFHKFISLH